MPKFEVSIITIIAFDAESKEEAQELVEMGETPHNHELVDTYISHIEELGE